MRLIFDGNFENQEVRYDEENQDELHRHTGRTFADFLLSRRAKGLAEKTLESYSSQWKAVAQHLDTGTDVAALQKADLDGGVVFYRHTKNRKAQVIPLCSPMIAILREYGRYRGGEPTDYLFCTETGTQLTENGLRQSIARYSTQRSRCLFAI